MARKYNKTRYGNSDAAKREAAVSASTDVTLHALAARSKESKCKEAEVETGAEEDAAAMGKVAVGLAKEKRPSAGDCIDLVAAATLSTSS